MFDSSVFQVNEANLSSRISQANHYLVEYEKEVERAQALCTGQRESVERIASRA